MITPSISDTELSAYVDGEVSSVRREAIETWIAVMPSAAARVAELRRQNEQLRAHFGAPVPRQRPPTSPRPEASARGLRALHLPEPLQHTSALENSRIEQRGRVALITAGSFLAGAGVAIVAATFVSFAPHLIETGRNTAARQISAVIITDPVQTMAAHVAATHRTFALDPTNPVEFAVGRAELTGIILRRTGLTFETPDLSSVGLSLLGGRIAPDEFGTAGFIVYEGQNGERIGVYVSPSGVLSLSTPAVVDASISVMLWTEANKTIAISGHSSRERLAAIAQKMRAQTIAAPALK